MTDQRFPREVQQEARRLAERSQDRQSSGMGFRQVMWLVFMAICIAVGIIGGLVMAARAYSGQQQPQVSSVEILVVLFMMCYAIGEASK